MAMNEFRCMVDRKVINRRDLKKGVWIYNLAYVTTNITKLRLKISKPCKHCTKVLEKISIIKKIFYTTNDMISNKLLN